MGNGRNVLISGTTREKNHMRSIVIGALFGAFSIGTACAADVAPASPRFLSITPSLQASHWTGFYAGAGVGYASLRDRADFTTVGTTDPFFTGKDQSGRLTFAGFAGYAWQFGKIVVGPEVLVGTGGKSGFYDASGVTGRGYVKEAYHVDGTAVVGYDMGRWMPYLKGGVSYANFHVDQGPTFAGMVHRSDNALGWVGGAGLAWKAFGNVEVRGEGRVYGFSLHNTMEPRYTVTTKDRVTIFEGMLSANVRF